MKQSHKLAAGIAAALGLGITVAASAHPGQMGGGMGPQHMQGRMHSGAQGGMPHGAKGGTQHGGMGGGAGHGAGQQLMTPEERTALQEKMRNATTPDERHQIATATRAEMHKRASEKGSTLHEGHGRHTGTAPAATGHSH